MSGAGAGKIQVLVDPEQTLEARVSRLEELEVARLGMHTLCQQEQKVQDAARMRRLSGAEHSMHHLSEAETSELSAIRARLKEAQEKAAGIVQHIVETVSSRFQRRDVRRGFTGPSS